MDLCRKYLIMTAGKNRCALPLEQVSEVLEPRVLSPVPGAPAWCSGAMATHDGVFMVLDLAAYLGNDGAEPAGKIIVLDKRAGGLALQVLQLEGIVTAEDHAGDDSNLRLTDGSAIMLDAATLVQDTAIALRR